MRLTTEQHDTLAAIIGRRRWTLPPLTGMERATLVLDHCARARIEASAVTPAQLSVAMGCMPLNAQDICHYADMACALAAVFGAMPKPQPDLPSPSDAGRDSLDDHSPGPWAVLDSGFGGQAIYSIPLHRVVQFEGRDYHDGLIALVYGHHDAAGAYSLRANQQVIAVAPELLALARQYASECADCNGTGTRTITTHPGGIEVDNDDQPCEACADIRAVIGKATLVQS